MFVRIELLGYCLQLGRLDTEEDVEPEADEEDFGIMDGRSPGPVDAYDEPELPEDHEMPVGFHQRQGANPEDV